MTEEAGCALGRTPRHPEVPAADAGRSPRTDMTRRFRRNKGPAGPDSSLEELAILASVLQHYPPGTKLHFGAPVRCPQCGDFGMVTALDRIAGVSTNYCRVCGIEWAMTARALRVTPDRSVAMPVGGLGPMFDALPAHLGGAAAGELQLLLVEDDAADAELVRSILSSSSAAVDLRHASTRREGERLASREPADIVLLDLGLPESQGLDTLADWRTAAPASPVVVVSGDTRREVIEGAREIGAAQFVGKHELVPLFQRGAAGAATLVDFLRLVVAVEGGPQPRAIPFGQSLLA
jgi:CheY-like chemotaxis protein